MLKWRFKELQDGEVATYSVSGIKAWVRDCDGDASIWEVRRGDKIIAAGECTYSGDGTVTDHFRLALGAAEGVLRAAVEYYKSLAVLQAK